MSARIKADKVLVNEYFNPEIDIPDEVIAVHHITNDKVRDKPVFRESDYAIKLKKLLDDNNNVLVAHNAKFDVSMLKKEGIEPKRIICTLRLSRVLDKHKYMSFIQYNNKITSHKSINFMNNQ